MNAIARSTDPTTSHEAAKTITWQHMSEQKRIIYAILQEPHTDEELFTMYETAVRCGLAPKASPSGVRTRRNELYREKLIEAVGYGKTISKRRSIVWQAS